MLYIKHPMPPELQSATPATIRVTVGGVCPLGRILPNDKRVKSLHSNDIPRFNGGMKIKMLTVAVAVGCVLGCASLTQQGKQTNKGTEYSCKNTQNTAQEAVGKNTE